MYRNMLWTRHYQVPYFESPTSSDVELASGTSMTVAISCSMRSTIVSMVWSKIRSRGPSRILQATCQATQKETELQTVDHFTMPPSAKTARFKHSAFVCQRPSPKESHPSRSNRVRDLNGKKDLEDKIRRACVYVKHRFRSR